jgi:hypothetical protein
MSFILPCSWHPDKNTLQLSSACDSSFDHTACCCPRNQFHGVFAALCEQVQDGLGPHQVLGVIPRALTPREVSDELIGDTKIVGDMHERKVRAVGTISQHHPRLFPPPPKQICLQPPLSCPRLLFAASVTPDHSVK